MGGADDGKVFFLRQPLILMGRYDLDSPASTLSRILSHEAAASVSGISLPDASPEQTAPRQFGATGPWTDLYQIGVIHMNW